MPRVALLEDEYRLVRLHGGAMKGSMGVLLMRGRDSIDFLQRMSTNDMILIKDPGTTCLTVLTTEKGRIIDLIRILNIGDSLMLLTSADTQTSVKTWLEKFILMEDVQLTDITSSVNIHSFLGINALDRYLSSFPMPASQLVLGTFWHDTGTNEYLFQDDLWHLRVHHLISRNDIHTDLAENGKSHLSSDLFESLRIDNGVPIRGREITEQINPLEASLDRYVSFTKGCYIGQEVIARLDTYDKLQKRLTGVVLEDIGQTTPSAGKLFVTGEEVGFTTSHSWSFQISQSVALGYIKKNVDSSKLEFEEISTRVRMKARLAKLPFGEGSCASPDDRV